MFTISEAYSFRLCSLDRPVTQLSDLCTASCAGIQAGFYQGGLSKWKAVKVKGFQSERDLSLQISLPPTNEVWGKVIISQLSVCPQGGGGSSWQRSPLDRNLLWKETPLYRDPPCTETPRTETPPPPRERNSPLNSDVSHHSQLVVLENMSVGKRFLPRYYDLVRTIHPI